MILERNGIDLEELHIDLWNDFLRGEGIIRFVESQERFERVCENFGLREKPPTKRKANFR